jgi:uncharacterized membrane protein
MTIPKKKDDELPVLIAVNGLFTIVLLLIDIFARAEMGWFAVVIVILFHIAAAYYWYVSVKNWKDPNKDWTRKLVLALVVIPSLIIMGYRAGYIEKKMFEQDVENAKSEQK